MTGPVLLAVDPSLRRTGYAVGRGLRPDQLLDGGYLTPDDQQGPMVLRVASLAQQLLEVARDEGVTDVVIEIPEHKSHQRVKGSGAGAGLARYGMAVGAMTQAMVAEFGLEHVVGVTPTGWKGGGSKANTRAGVAAIYPSYAAAIQSSFKDSGGDLADAIGVMRWRFGCMG